MNRVMCVACLYGHRVLIFIVYGLRDQVLGNLEEVVFGDQPHQFPRFVLRDLIQVDVGIDLAPQNTASPLEMDLSHRKPCILTSWVALLSKVNSFTSSRKELGMVESLV